MASGTWASTLATPFAKLGTALGTGARGVSDFVGFTDPLGAEAITGAGTGVVEYMKRKYSVTTHQRNHS